MKSTSSYRSGTLTGPQPDHSRARAVFRFFLYLSCFAMYAALTWGHDSPGVDPKSLLVAHGFFIAMLLIILIGEVIAYHSFNSLSPHTSGHSHSFGEEIFGIVLIALFWTLRDGLKWQSLPDEVYAKHLDGALTVVFWAILLIILWYDGIFDRR
jgi:hypothetical protein